MDNKFVRIIKDYFLRRSWGKIAMSFIFLSVTVITPGFWEFVLFKVLLGNEEGVKSTIEMPQWIAAVILASIGIAILIYIYKVDKKKEYFEVTLSSETSWIKWQGDNNEANCEYIFEIPFRIINGIVSIHIVEIDIQRIVHGQNVWGREPRLFRQSDQATINFESDYKSLRSRLRIAPYDVIDIMYIRNCRKILNKNNPEIYEKAEYQIKIKFKYENMSSILIRTYLIRQNHGDIGFVRD